MHAAATLGTRAVAGARGHARMQKSEPVNVTKKFLDTKENSLEERAKHTLSGRKAFAVTSGAPSS